MRSPIVFCLLLSLTLTCYGSKSGVEDSASKVNTKPQEKEAEERLFVGGATPLPPAPPPSIGYPPAKAGGYLPPVKPPVIKTPVVTGAPIIKTSYGPPIIKPYGQPAKRQPPFYKPPLPKLPHFHIRQKPAAGGNFGIAFPVDGRHGIIPTGIAYPVDPAQLPGAVKMVGKPGSAGLGLTQTLRNLFKFPKLPNLKGIRNLFSGFNLKGFSLKDFGLGGLNVGIPPPPPDSHPPPPIKGYSKGYAPAAPILKGYGPPAPIKSYAPVAPVKGYAPVKGFAPVAPVKGHPPALYKDGTIAGPPVYGTMTQHFAGAPVPIKSGGAGIVNIPPNIVGPPIYGGTYVAPPIKGTVPLVSSYSNLNPVKIPPYHYPTPVSFPAPHYGSWKPLVNEHKIETQYNHLPPLVTTTLGPPIVTTEFALSKTPKFKKSALTNNIVTRSTPKSTKKKITPSSKPYTVYKSDQDGDQAEDEPIIEIVVQDSPYNKKEVKLYRDDVDDGKIEPEPVDVYYVEYANGNGFDIQGILPRFNDKSKRSDDDGFRSLFVQDKSIEDPLEDPLEFGASETVESVAKPKADVNVKVVNIKKQESISDVLKSHIKDGTIYYGGKVRLDEESPDKEYLPLRLHGSKFPLPDTPQLKDREIHSVVVLTPQDFKETYQNGKGKTGSIKSLLLLVKKPGSEKETKVEEEQAEKPLTIKTLQQQLFQL